MHYQPPLPFEEARTTYIDQRKAQSLLDEASPLLWHAIMHTWDDLQGSRRDDPRFRFFSEGDAAWWMHSQIKQFVQTLCEDRPDIGLATHTTQDNQFYLSLRSDLILVFKKLTRVYSRKLMRDVLVRSNYPTKHNCDFWAQRQEAGLDAPRLVVGYEPIKAMSEVRLHVGYPRSKGHQFDWIYEMDNQIEAATKLFKEQVARDEQKQRRDRGFEVSPRSDRADETATS